MLMMVIYFAEGYVHTVYKNTDALMVASVEIGLDVNTDKTKYMVMSRDQNAGRSHSIKTDNSSVERVQMFGNSLNRSKLYSGRN